MATWRDELVEAVKSKAERESEEQARYRKRVEEALSTAEAGLKHGAEAIQFTAERLKEKQQQADLSSSADRCSLVFAEQHVTVELSRETAVLKVTFTDNKPREFDFVKDRHITAQDVEEYVGRRCVELVKTIQRAKPW